MMKKTADAEESSLEKFDLQCSRTQSTALMSEMLSSSSDNDDGITSTTTSYNTTQKQTSFSSSSGHRHQRQNNNRYKNKNKNKNIHETASQCVSFDFLSFFT